MADRPMLMVICYDIAGAKARAKVAALLEDRAVRVQESVFEARLTRAAAERLFGEVATWLDDADSLRMYGISATGLARSRAVGAAVVPEDAAFWII